MPKKYYKSFNTHTEFIEYLNDDIHTINELNRIYDQLPYCVELTVLIDTMHGIFRVRFDKKLDHYETTYFKLRMNLDTSLEYYITKCAKFKTLPKLNAFISLTSTAISPLTVLHHRICKQIDVIENFHKNSTQG